MKTKYSKFEIILFCLGALLFGAIVYIKFHPQIYLDAVYALRQKIVEAKHNEGGGVSYSATVYIHPDIQGGIENIGKHTISTDSILQQRMQLAGYEVDQLDKDIPKGILNYRIHNVTNKEALYSLLSSRGDIKVCNTYEASEVFTVLTSINERLREEAKKAPKKKEGNNDDDVFGNMVVGDSIVQAVEPDESDENPLFQVLYPNIINGQIGEGALVAYAKQDDMRRVNEYLNMPGAKGLYPLDLVFYWSAAELSEGVYGLYAVKGGARNIIITGQDMSDASPGFNDMGLPEVYIQLRTGAVDRWANATAAAANHPVIKKCIAILCDDKVLMAPRVQTRIDGGRMSISGTDLEDAKATAAIIKTSVFPSHVIVKIY